MGEMVGLHLDVESIFRFVFVEAHDASVVAENLFFENTSFFESKNLFVVFF